MILVRGAVLVNKEELVNLSMKETILNKWKSKLSYQFNYKDLEELESIITYYEEENAQLKKQYCERTDCGGRLGNSKKVEELIKENEKLNHYKLLYQKVKDRNNEAIEYIKGHMMNPELMDEFEYISTSPKKLLEILKGKNEEINNDKERNIP